jgi:hypothetical protein
MVVDCFRLVPVPPRPTAPVSALTLALGPVDLSGVLAPAKKTANTTTYNVYVPGGRSVTVYMRAKSTVDDIVKEVLLAHQFANMMPPLEYDAPLDYELRIEDGKNMLV